MIVLVDRSDTHQHVSGKESYYYSVILPVNINLPVIDRAPCRHMMVPWPYSSIE